MRLYLNGGTPQEAINRYICDARRFGSCPQRWRVRSYCRAAILEVQQAQKARASATLNEARAVAKDDIVDLCRIAQVRLMINPGRIPEELDRAADLEEGRLKRFFSNPDREKHQLSFHARPLCRLAKCYHLAGDVASSRGIIKNAEKCADTGTNPEKFLKDLRRIAKVRKLQGFLEEALETLDKAKKHACSFPEFSARILAWVGIAEQMISICPTKARNLVALAETSLGQINENNWHWRCVSASIRIEAFLKEWDKYPDSSIVECSSGSIRNFESGCMSLQLDTSPPDNF